MSGCSMLSWKLKVERLKKQDKAKSRICWKNRSMVIIFQNQKQMAKITDFFTLGTSIMGQYYNTFSVFRNYGAKHNSERDSCVYKIS